MNQNFLSKLFARYRQADDYINGINTAGDKVLTRPGESLIDASNRLGMVDSGDLKSLNKKQGRELQLRDQLTESY